MAHVTIKDVARSVGLSVTTVSRALNNHDDVAEETRRRIQETARELDYHPNVLARGLQNRRANAIGLLIPLSLHRTYDAFWLEFIGGAAACCASRHIDLLVSATDDQKELSPDFRRVVRGRRVDGVLICDVRRDDRRIAYLQHHRLPFVAFGRTSDGHDYSFIDVDGAAGASQAVEHLVQLGHRRIAYLGVDPDFGFSHFRLQGYCDALRRARIPVDPALVREGLTEDSAPNAVAELLGHNGSAPTTQRPTAIFAAADFLAIAALKAARETDLQVPSDLSICVFDDSPLVQHAAPPLSAVSQPNRRLGEEAAAMLLARIEKPGGPLVQRTIVPSLVARQSTGAAPRQGGISGN